MFYNKVMSTNNASVSVIIPVYNRATLWLRTVDSVMQQTLLPCQLVIVNDGSTDSTAANIRKWLGGKDTATIGGVEVTLLSQAHANASVARNRGLSFVGGGDVNYDYVLFLDSDDELAPNFIQDATKVLDAESDVVAVSSPRLSLVEGDGSAAAVFDDLQSLAQSPVRWILYNGAAILSCSLFRSNALPKSGFDSSMLIGEDMLFASQVAMAGQWSVLGGAPTKFWRQAGIIGEEPSLSVTHGTKDNPRATIESIQARVLAFNQVRRNKRVGVSYSYLHGILRDFYLLAFTAAKGMAKYNYGFRIAYHSAMRWLTWLIRR